MASVLPIQTCERWITQQDGLSRLRYSWRVSRREDAECRASAERLNAHKLVSAQSNDDGPKDVSLDARIYGLFKFLCFERAFYTLMQCHLRRGATPRLNCQSVFWCSMKACGCTSSNSTSLLLARITANLGRKPFAWAENGLRGVCRPPGCVSRVELQVCILDFCLYLSLYCYEGGKYDAGTAYEDITCRCSYDYFSGV